jgi:hypothetical protein
VDYPLGGVGTWNFREFVAGDVKLMGFDAGDGESFEPFRSA